MEKEIWKDIEGYEGRYQVSNRGRVKSLKRDGRTEDIILTGNINTAGNRRPHWRLVCLSKDLKAVERPMHHLVAEAFIPNPENHKNVRLLNGDPDDIYPENLEWYTAQGEDSKQAKLTDKKVLDIRAKYKTGGYTYKDLAKANGVCEQSIYHVVKRKTWKHI